MPPRRRVDGEGIIALLGITRQRLPQQPERKGGPDPVPSPFPTKAYGIVGFTGTAEEAEYFALHPELLPEEGR